MSPQAAVPRFMEQLLNELGWSEGTRIPLANAENQVLENLLIERQNEIQRLKEALLLQQNKQKDLNKYKENVHSEYQENTRLLFALKQQLEQDVKIHQLALNEYVRLEREIKDNTKQNKEIKERVERHQAKVSQLLKKAETLKEEVCGEQNALAEWRAALARNAHDLDAIAKFTKQDMSKAKALETKRQQLKVEHDRYEARLNALVADISAEERACNRVCTQVMEAMQERKDMMNMWSNAVENLRQRDIDIRHIKEDYKILEVEASKVAEKCREQQAFAEQQQADNAEVEREIAELMHKLGQYKSLYQQLIEINLTLVSEEKSLTRELANMQKILEGLHIENRTIKEDQIKKREQIVVLKEKIKKLKVKLEDSMDKTKSAEKRAKELEEMLSEEEKYATNMTTLQQRALHCSFVEQKKLLALKNEEKYYYMQIKATNATITKLENKKVAMEKQIQSQKEELYVICYQLESVGARIMDMEGKMPEKEFSVELVERENRLKDVLARHAGRVSILERHSARLQDDMRRLSKGLEIRGEEHSKLVTCLRTWMLRVEGCTKELKELREKWRADRVEEALMKMRVAHGERALAGLDDTKYTLDVQRLRVDAAMKERMVEIKGRCDVFKVQKRTLMEECGELRSDIMERERRITQLIKRYDIFITSLGKDDSGQQITVAFFKIKFAAERAELRARGASLDADITRREKDVSALEATLRVVAAAHSHFMHRVLPLEEDTPEVKELNKLNKDYYKLRDELKVVKADTEEWEPKVTELSTKVTMLSDKNKQLAARMAETEAELDVARDRAEKQEQKLQNAKDVVRHYRRRAKKLFHDIDEWRIFQMSIWLRDYDEAAQNAVQSLSDLSTTAPEAYKQFSVLVMTMDIEKFTAKYQRRLAAMLRRIVTSTSKDLVSKDQIGGIEVAESVFSPTISSTHSGLSIASGFNRRLAVLRKDLGEKLKEPQLLDDIPDAAKRSTVSLRIVTLNIGDPGLGQKN